MKTPICCLLAIVLFTAGGFPWQAQADVPPAARSETYDPAQNLPYLDSLYTFAYLKHRVHQCLQRFDVPAAARHRLQAAAATGDSLLHRLPGQLRGRYAYLPFWITHPELEEDSAMAQFGISRPPAADCQADTAGYTAFQQQLTVWRLASNRYEAAGDTAAAIAYRDSIIRHIAFYSDDLFRAKRLAVASRDTDAYLRLLRYDPYRSLSEKARVESRWPLANTPSKRQFVRACLQKADSTTMPALRREALEVTLCVNRFENLHSIMSNCIFTSGAVRAWFTPHKQALRRIYCELVAETYTAVPAVFCRYLQDRDSIAPVSMSTLGYFSLHLIQTNSFGRIYPQAVFEDYFRFLQTLVYRRRYDMEGYVSYHDMYLTAVLRQASAYGFTLRRKGLDLIDGSTPSEMVEARRRAAHLLPLDQALHE